MCIDPRLVTLARNSIKNIYKNALGSEEALACLSHPCVGASYFVITFPAAPMERKLAQNPAVVAANMLYEIKQQRTAAGK